MSRSTMGLACTPREVAGRAAGGDMPHISLDVFHEGLGQDLGQLLEQGRRNAGLRRWTFS